MDARHPIRLSSAPSRGRRRARRASNAVDSVPLDPGTLRFASRRRLLLAAYLDFCLFGALWGLVLHVAPRPFHQPFLDLVAFIPLELLLFHTDRSPGQRMLGIRRVDPESIATPDAPQVGRHVHLADAGLLARESILTLALGVLLVNDGAKSVVRWTLWHVPEPWFGIEAAPALDVALRIGVGAAEIAAAWATFQLLRRALPAILGLLAVLGASVVMSWGRWDAWVAREAAARAAWFGRPLEPDRITTMQAIVPEALLVWLAALLVAYAFAARRFTR
jgi:hypothetical protein